MEAYGWQAFAQMSRDALRPAGKRAAKSLRKRGEPAAPQGTKSIEQATSQALRLGRTQAAWIVEQRKDKLAQRARNVVGASARPAKKKKPALRIKRAADAARAPTAVAI